MTTIRLPEGVTLIVSRVLDDILDAAGIAPGPDVVGRVRSLAAAAATPSAPPDVMEWAQSLAECDTALDRAGIIGTTTADRVREMARRLDASERDRVGLLATVEALRGERDSARRHHTNGLETIRKSDEKCAALRAERDALRAELKNSLASESRWEATLRQLRDERDGARQDLHKEGGAAMSTLAEMVREVCEDLAHVKAEALRAPKVAAVEWRGTYLHVGGSKVSWVDQPRIDRWRVGAAACGALGLATSKESAMRLAELLANHDPGGVWRIGKDIVSPDTVRLVCPSVAVTWGEA